ncbi:MAG: YihY/virulence factor BrkB family protein [Bryobacteraceae bacterium]
MRRVWPAVGRAFVSAYRDDVSGYAKGAAYSALLAFFPLLATVAMILVSARAEFVADAISDFLSQILPPGTQDLVFDYFVTKGRPPVLVPIAGALVSVWAGSGVMVSLMQGFHVAYRMPPAGRPLVKEWMVAILLVFLAAIPVLVASALVLFGAYAERWTVWWLGLVPAGAELRGSVAVIGSMARYVIALGALVLGASILYYVGPNRPQRWRAVWPGAVLATILWLAATSSFAWYARHLASYNVMYGSIATVILLVVWMYVLAIIAFLGCEFNVELERSFPEFFRKPQA